MTSRLMWAVVCDDVRQEFGNKVSFMGIYGGEILLPAFPVSLPKLCAAVNVRTITDEPFERLAVLILRDDVELARLEVPPEQLAAMKANVAAFGEEGYMNVSFMYQFSPFVIEHACTLRFRAETERETLKGGSIRISALPGLPQIGPSPSGKPS